MQMRHTGQAQNLDKELKGKLSLNKIGLNNAQQKSRLRTPRVCKVVCVRYGIAT